MRAIFTFAIALIAASALAQQITSETVTGVTNFKKLETTIACAGATTPQAVPEIKKMGYASIINLRVPTEEGADVDQEAAAAKAAGIKFYSLPLNGQKPDPAVADKFLAVIADTSNEPAFIHCHSGNRAAAMWMIKRLVADHWDADRASAEAAQLGLTSGALKTFALEYAASHK